MRINGNLILNDNGSGEIRHVYIERVDSATELMMASSLNNSNVGRLIFNTTSNQFKYWNNGAFFALASGVDAGNVQTELDTLEASLGTIVNADGSFSAAALAALVNIDATASTTLTQVLFDIDRAISGIDVSSQITPIQTEIDSIETAVGLTSTGILVPFTGMYTSGETSIASAIGAIDAALNTVATSVTNAQSEIDAIETGAGLSATGTYTADAATNYLKTASSLKDADVKLDTQVKLVAGALSTLETTILGKQDDLGYTPIDAAGGSVTGTLTFNGTSTITGLAAPVEPTDAVRKIDLELLQSGLDFQTDVLGREDDFTSTVGRYIYTNGTTFTNTSSLDVSQNDIVVVDGTGNITNVAYDVTTQGPGALTWDRSLGLFVKWDGTTWSEFGGLSGVTAGSGLVKTGNTISVKYGPGIIETETGAGIGVKPASGIALVDPTTGLLSTSADAVLSSVVTGALQVNSSGIDVKSSGIDEFKLATSVAGAGLVGGAGTPLAVNVSTGLKVAADAVSLDLTYTDTRYINTAGDTMTGALVLSGNAVGAKDAVPKQQLDVETQARIDLAAAIRSEIAAGYVAHTFTTTGATAPITVTHNIGSKYCNVTVVSSDDEVFIPQSIKFINANVLTVTLNADISGTVVVMGKKV